MKKIFSLIILFIVVLTSCKDNWNEHYQEFGTNGNVAEEIIDCSLKEFFQNHQEYSQFYEWISEAGIDEMISRDQYMTIWVVTNDVFASKPDFEDNEDLARRYHANYLAFGKNDLKDGLRIKALNNIYLQINVTPEDVLINKSSKVIDSYRVNNGVVYQLDSFLEPKVSIYDYLYNLGDEYSIIRDSIFKYNEKVFDKLNSTPIGVDKTGNTVYDSVFYVYNPLFDKAEFNSQFKQFTAFIPENKVIEDCLSKLSVQYSQMGKSFGAEDSVLAMTWIKEAAFYNGVITDFSKQDISSAFSRVWRTTVQELDTDNPIELSNGIIYNVTNLKVPNNVIITRIKSLLHYWEYLAEDERETFYSVKGATSAPTMSVLDATPKPEILEKYICFVVSGDLESTDEFSVEFCPLERYMDETGTYQARKMMVPPGEYYFYMGFNSQVHPYCNVYFNNQLLYEGAKISDSTPWNYDRVTETSAETSGDAVKKWDGLGGLCGTVLIEGDEMQTFTAKVEFNKLNSIGDPKRLRIYHWALKPTANNY